MTDTSPNPEPPRVVDVDRHVMEPMWIWREYMPSRLHDKLPQLIPQPPREESYAHRSQRLGELAPHPAPAQLCIDGRPIMDIPESGAIVCALQAAALQVEFAGTGEAAGHLAHMDRQGIGASVLMPTFASYLAHNQEEDAVLCHAYADAYNRWLMDLCDGHRDRLLPAALVSRHRPETCAAAVKQAVARGFRYIVIRPNPVDGHTLGAPVLEAFWSTCEELDVAVFLHEGSHARIQTAGHDRYTSRFGQHAASHPIEAMLGILSLIEGGVLERHPTLRVAVLEAGCGWLPYWLDRLDREYEDLRAEVGHRVRRRPSEYVARQCWVGIEAGEPMLAEILHAIDGTRLVFGSDYPHLDHAGEIRRALDSVEASLGPDHSETVTRSNALELLTGGGREWP